MVYRACVKIALNTKNQQSQSAIFAKNSLGQTSKIELFAKIVKGFKLLAIFVK